jgi:hypothetical protein
LSLSEEDLSAQIEYREDPNFKNTSKNYKMMGMRFSIRHDKFVELIGVIIL